MLQEGLDGLPEWPEMQKKGMSFDEYNKFIKNETLEYMKSQLQANKNDMTEEEINEAEEIIKQYEHEE